MTYSKCYHITGNPVCGENVTDFCGTYQNCSNLTGSPVCGNNVNLMIASYLDCKYLSPPDEKKVRQYGILESIKIIKS